jgi:hypothetical protein
MKPLMLILAKACSADFQGRDETVDILFTRICIIPIQRRWRLTRSWTRS